MIAKSKELYLNAKQAQVVCSNKKNTIFQAGRGTGKTTVEGDRMNRRFRELPRARGFLLGTTFKQINKNFLPEILGRMQQYGFRHHASNKIPGHYVFNRTPPGWYAKPYSKPEDYSNIVTFCNGLTLDMVSFDRPDTLRGGSYDFGIIDEAGDIDYNKLKKTILPRIRGNRNKPISVSPLHHAIDILGSMPWKDIGQWLVEELKAMASKKPDKHMYVESSAEDNRAVLGDEYFEDQFDRLGPLTYQVEILNKKLTKLPNGFYSELDDKHFYTDSYDYSLNDSGIWLANDKDIKPDQPIEVSFDFNAKFSSCIACQSDSKEFRILKNFYVKNQTFDALVDKFCNYYKDHKRKYVYIYGGKDGADDRPNSQYTYFQQIAARFRHNKWMPDIQYDYTNFSDRAHKLRHSVINNLLREADPGLVKIRINENNCKELILSMQLAPITGEFKKDKSSERQDIPQERATHLSDCFDNIVYPKYHSIVENNGQLNEVFFG